MTKRERENWIINIENTSAAIEAQLGPAIVQSVLKRFGARSIDDLNPNDFSEVFNELYAIETDIDESRTSCAARNNSLT